MSFTVENVLKMTIKEAQQLGVQRFRDGYTFAQYNVRPIGFVDACVKAHRMDLIKALDYGWHVANMAEPVVLDDGTVIGSVVASKQLEMICQG